MDASEIFGMGRFIWFLYFWTDSGDEAGKFGSGRV